MSGGHDKRRQQKLEKARKKRALASKQAKERRTPTTDAEWIRRATNAPAGPTWISATLGDPARESVTDLVTILVTRRVGGLLVPELILVDRTCLGVKNATVLQPMTEAGVEQLVERYAEGADDLEPCGLLLAQSVVYHAIDYARSLGFAPHRDFVPSLLGPRPEQLLDTPLCRPSRPRYIAGPDDDVMRIVRQLTASVGPGGFDLVGPEGASDEDDEELLDGTW